ncbi:hypothetical protein HBB16_20080 [Pseudonocardia sp. MCCB 268]|nr:hypothetical protein [Pseudonocardia cytotoxica]
MGDTLSGMTTTPGTTTDTGRYHRGNRRRHSPASPGPRPPAPLEPPPTPPSEPTTTATTVHRRRYHRRGTGATTTAPLGAAGRHRADATTAIDTATTPLTMRAPPPTLTPRRSRTSRRSRLRCRPRRNAARSASGKVTTLSLPGREREHRRGPVPLWRRPRAG